VLTHENMAATNTFEDPNQVTLSEIAVAVSGNGAAVNMPPKSVVALDLRIA
jgi:alpha-L-arabinofuranosidase